MQIIILVRRYLGKLNQTKFRGSIIIIKRRKSSIDKKTVLKRN